MAIQVQQFTPQRIVQQAQQNRVNPWAQLLPNLTQAVVMGMVQNKLQGNLQKEQIKQEMLSKGYVWDEEKQTWLPPAIQQEDIGDSGDKLITQGGAFKDVYQSPTSRSRLRTQEALDQLKAGHQYDLEKLDKQASLQETAAQRDARLRQSEWMLQHGITVDDKGKYSYAPFTTTIDEKSGMAIMQHPTGTRIERPIVGQVKVKEIAEIPGHYSATLPDGSTSIIKKPQSWRDEKTGKPFVYDIEYGGRNYGLMMQSENSAMLIDNPTKKDMTLGEANDNIVMGLRDSEYADKTPQALSRLSELVNKEKKTVAEAYAQTLNEITTPKSDLSTSQGIKAGTKIGNRTVSKTGKEKGTGRTVIQFTDGTTTYAD